MATWPARAPNQNITGTFCSRDLSLLLQNETYESNRFCFSVICSLMLYGGGGVVLSFFMILCGCACVAVCFLFPYQTGTFNTI